MSRMLKRKDWGTEMEDVFDTNVQLCDTTVLLLSF